MVGEAVGKGAKVVILNIYIYFIILSKLYKVSQFCDRIVLFN